ncbi:hypothetical protein QAD02_011278 [Eretmocerus hayati]|uniref:Uncharacterized protein n=1 Tax=Eretmocerus hayati TaxID=131215 RepID=A0ACC2NZ46_9HYME|nr:hypothetical protein QAD02_011278 [Eretmocerus hayati]
MVPAGESPSGKCPIGRMASGKKDRAIQEANVILVDWSSVYTTEILGMRTFSLDAINYQKAVFATEFVAKQIGRFLREVSKSCNKPLNQWYKLHIIGHSLGAHIAGQAARYLRDVVQVQRVTGLDPAGPCFEGVNTEFKLHRSDAVFVDVIHTNCDPSRQNNFGIAEALGTVDFYPNRGNFQPICRLSSPRMNGILGSLLESSGIYRGLVDGWEIIHQSLFGAGESFNDLASNLMRRGRSLVCDHMAAIRYFIDSVETPDKKVFAVPGSSWRNGRIDKDLRRLSHAPEMCVEMGMNAERYHNARGIYFLNTTNETPGCSGN